jgi:hypothetical protein
VAASARILGLKQRACPMESATCCDAMPSLLGVPSRNEGFGSNERLLSRTPSGPPNATVLQPAQSPGRGSSRHCVSPILLLQAGGFSAIVLDLGSIAPEHVSRIPLATWFRYGAAAERSRTSVLLLTQHACSKSSAGLVLRLQAGPPLSGESTVLAGFERHVEVSRQRFTEVSAKVVPFRKPPQRASGADWQSKTAWAGIR